MVYDYIGSVITLNKYIYIYINVGERKILVILVLDIGNPCARKHTDDGGLAQKCLY